jgi:hypothetical protein
LQVSMKGSSMNTSTNTVNSKYASGQIHELGMGFKKPGTKWSCVFGLNPYSSVDYSFLSAQTFSDSLAAEYSYKGSGGLNKVTIGGSRLFRYKRSLTVADSAKLSSPDSIQRVVHQISIGANANYIFGNISRINRVDYNNSLYYDTYNKVNLWTRGFIFEVGLLYKVNLSTKRDDQKRIIGGSLLQIGIDYNLNGNLFADYSELLLAVKASPTFLDTAYNLESERGRLKIPQKISFGLAYKIYSKKAGTFTFAGDYKLQDWSKYQLAITSDAHLDKGLSTSYILCTGMEYKPSTDINSSFFRRLSYRAGYRTSETPIILNNNRIKQQGITAGISIPIIKSQSKFHIGAEYGNTGTTTAGLVQEKYVTIMAGFTLTPSSFDRWFRQIKYD